MVNGQTYRTNPMFIISLRVLKLTLINNDASRGLCNDALLTWQYAPPPFTLYLFITFN